MGINFQNVNFKYNKKGVARTLNDINLKINGQDEFITILGHTGSGKSTLVQLMNALLIPDSGTVNVFDQEVSKSKNKNLKFVREKVGLVFQFPEYQLFEETVLKDIMFGPMNFGKTKEEAESVARHSAKLVGLSEEILEKSPFNLSGGQMRRVAIAGILASNPDILILDEPTVGLDPKGKLEIIELLKKIQAKTHKTIILVTHDMSVVAEVSKRVLVMKQGNLVCDCTPRQLFTNIELLESYNLDLPIISKLALDLKKEGIIDFDTLPIRRCELENAIMGLKQGDMNE